MLVLRTKEVVGVLSLSLDWQLADHTGLSLQSEKHGFDSRKGQILHLDSPFIALKKQLNLLPWRR